MFSRIGGLRKRVADLVLHLCKSVFAPGPIQFCFRSLTQPACRSARQVTGVEPALAMFLLSIAMSKLLCMLVVDCCCKLFMETNAWHNRNLLAGKFCLC